MRPTVVFHGHVNPAPMEAALGASVALPPPTTVADRRANLQPSLMTRVRNFFQKLGGKGPCEGSGCTN
jgi:hypothetical protein